MEQTKCFTSVLFEAVSWNGFIIKTFRTKYNSFDRNENVSKHKECVELTNFCPAGYVHIKQLLVLSQYYKYNKCATLERAKFWVGSLANVLDHLEPGQRTFVSAELRRKSWALWNYGTIENIYILKLLLSPGGLSHCF